jgi:hypothetical protein
MHRRSRKSTKTSPGMRHFKIKIPNETCLSVKNHGRFLVSLGLFTVAVQGPDKSLSTPYIDKVPLQPYFSAVCRFSCTLLQ